MRAVTDIDLLCFTKISFANTDHWVNLFSFYSTNQILFSCEPSLCSLAHSGSLDTTSSSKDCYIKSVCYYSCNVLGSLYLALVGRPRREPEGGALERRMLRLSVLLLLLKLEMLS